MAGKSPPRNDFKAIFAELPGLYLVLSPDLEIVAATKAYLKATATTEAITGRNLFEVFPDSDTNESRLGASNLRRSLELVRRQGVRDVMAIQRYDIWRADEGRYEVRYWSPVNFPLFGETGELRWILHRVQDVTGAFLRGKAAAADLLSDDAQAAAELAELEAEIYTSGLRLQKLNGSLRESEHRLKVALEGGRMAPWHGTLQDESVRITPELLQLLGFPPEATPTMADLRRGYLPGERDRLVAAIAEAHREGRDHVEIEFQYRRPIDGEVRWLMLRGELAGTRGNGQILGVVVDITRLKRAEFHQSLLINELNHRVKNTLSVVQSLARQSFRAAASLPEARDAFDARLVALAHAHDLLTSKHWEGADVREIVRRATSPYETSGQFDIEGPSVCVNPAAAVSLSLALHELITNAVKYGALSTPEGCVEVRWSVEAADDGAPHLEFRWQERGGPPVRPPLRRGFGSVLLTRGASSDLGAKADLHYEPGGLRYVLNASRFGPPPQAGVGGEGLSRH